MWSLIKSTRFTSACNAKGQRNRTVIEQAFPSEKGEQSTYRGTGPHLSPIWAGDLTTQCLDCGAGSREGPGSGIGRRFLVWKDSARRQVFEIQAKVNGAWVPLRRTLDVWWINWWLRLGLKVDLGSELTQLVAATNCRALIVEPVEGEAVGRRRNRCYKTSFWWVVQTTWITSDLDREYK